MFTKFYWTPITYILLVPPLRVNACMASFNRKEAETMMLPPFIPLANSFETHLKKYPISTEHQSPIRMENSTMYHCISFPFLLVQFPRFLLPAQWDDCQANYLLTSFCPGLCFDWGGGRAREGGVRRKDRGDPNKENHAALPLSTSSRHKYEIDWWEYIIKYMK